MGTAALGSDEALMDAYRGGEPGAFDALFTRHSASVYRFFLRSFRDPVLSEDLLQTTFLNVHRGRGTFRLDDATASQSAPFRRWLFGIAVRVRLDAWAARRRNREVVVDEIPESSVALAPTPSRAAWLAEALERLPPRRRAIVHLHYVQELSFREIAARLGASEGAVKLRAFRAYEQLRADARASASP